MKISVIIPSLNGAKFIAKAIESFLSQGYEHKELLIVDGVSNDGTHEIISSYQEKFPQIIKWIKEKDSGISNARNIALKYVTGDLIGFLGVDDFLHKGFFDEAVYYIKENPNFDIIHFNSYCVGLTNGFNASATISVTKRNMIKHCPIGSGESFYYRKEIFSDFQFNEKNRYCMDYELNMALVSSLKPDGKKYSFYPVNITAVFNSDTGENISSSSSKKQRIETILVQLKYAKNLLEKFKIILHGKKLILKNYSFFCKKKKDFLGHF